MKYQNIAIINPYFPPINSIATQRIYSFAKYLSKLGYNIVVLTMSKDSSIDGYDFQIEEYAKVYRFPNKIFFKRATFDKRTNVIFHKLKALYNTLLVKFYTDEYTGWRNEVLKHAAKIIQDENITLIISSFAPVSSHLIALDLVNNNSNLKWILDMRDQMSSNPFYKDQYKEKLSKIEHKISKRADAVISVSEPILKDFDRIFDSHSIKYREIRNGYDFDIQPIEVKNEQFTISYVGTFYGERNPDNFLKGLSELVEAKIIENIKINFIGVGKPFTVPSNLKKSVEFKDKVTHNEALGYMANSDALLLIHPTSGGKGVFTGKLFEYLASLRIIFAFVDTEDVAAKLIEECNAGFVAKNEDIEGIKNAIKKGYDLWKNGKKIDFNIDIIKTLHRSKQIEKLSQLIQEL